MYRGPSRGQGIGSMMHGVAATLALAPLFDRTACVAWRTFERAWSQHHRCPPKSEYFIAPEGTSTAVLTDAVVERWSFDESAREPLPEALLSGNRSAVVMHGDGGARHGSSETRLEFPFSPHPELAALLGHPRRVVVHLRLGDPHEPSRRGILREDRALELLQAMLPADAYVLSDSDEVYGALCHRFECPSWRAIPHSAEREMRVAHHRGAAHQRESLQAWADWAAIRSAMSLVLHTPSAFSESALRFSSAASCELLDHASLAECAERAKEGAPSNGRVEL